MVSPLLIYPYDALDIRLPGSRGELLVERKKFGCRAFGRDVQGIGKIHARAIPSEGPLDCIGILKLDFRGTSKRFERVQDVCTCQIVHP